MSAKIEKALQAGDIITEDDLDLGELLNWLYWRYVFWDGEEL
jgi:hypothetical protein